MMHQDPREEALKNRVDRQREHSIEHVALLCGGVTVFIGILGLLGWLLRLPILTALHPSYIPIASNTCIGFIVLGTHLILHIHCPSRVRQWHLVPLVAAISTLGMLTFIGYLTGSGLNFDGLVIIFSSESLGTFPINRISPLTGILLCLSGTTLLLLRFQAKVLVLDFATGLASLVAMAGLIGTLSYAYGTPLLYGSTIIPMALPTSVAFLFLGCGLIAAAGPTGFPQRLLTGNSVRAMLLRTFVPLGFMAVIGSDILRHMITKLNSALVLAASAVFFAMVTVAVVAQASRRIGNAIEKAEAEIHRLNRLYDVLSQVNHAIVQIESRDELLSTVCRLVVERGTIDLAWIGWLDPETSKIAPSAYFGNRAEMVSESHFYADDRQEWQGTPGKAVREGKISMCNECGSNPCPYHSEQMPARFGFRSCGSFPIRFGGHVCGALTLCVAEQGFFQEPEIELLNEVAENISFALDKIEGEARQRQAEEAARESKDLYQTLIDASPDAISVTDTQGLLTFVSPRALEIFGLSPDDDVIGRSVFDWVSPAQRELALNNLGHILAGGAPRDREYTLIKKDGTHFVGEVNVATINSPDDNPKGMLLITRDITERKRAEEALRASEERFRLAMQGANDGLWDRNFETGEVYYSPRWKSMLGYTDTELENHLDIWKRLIHPDDLEPTEAKASELIEGQVGQFEAEFRMRHKDGHYVNILSRAFLFQNDGGFRRLVGTHVDISERKAAEQALAEEAIRRRILFEQSRDGIVVLDQNGKVYEANQQYAEMLGYNAEEVRHLHVWDWDANWTQEDLLERMRLADAEGTVFETRHRRKDGTIYDVEISHKAFELAGQKLVFCACRDISQRKAAEQVLLDSEIYNRSLVEHLPQRIFLKDHNSVYISCNPKYAQDLGIEPEDIICKDDYAFFPREMADAYRADDQAVMAAKMTKDIEERYIVEGKEKWIHTIKVPYHNETGNIIGVMGIFEDITERKQAEEERVRVEAQLRQAQKMEALGTLAGGVAHDFNNILGIIMGFTELAKWELGKKNPVAGKLDEVLNAADRAKELVKQILAFSRRTEQQKIPMQLGMIVKEALKILRPSLPSTIEIRTEVLSKAAVLADSTQLHQVLMNLCTNAAQAMQEGGVLEVRLTDVLVEGESNSIQGGLEAGTLRGTYSHRHRMRHRSFHNRFDLRSLFHHQRTGSRHRAGLIRGPWNRKQS